MQEDTKSTPESVDLSQSIESNVETIRSHYSTVSVSKSVSTDFPPAVVTGFNEAIENVLLNAVGHNDTNEPRITITAQKGDETVTIRIAGNGPGIPADEIKPLKAGQETALHHASGLGLWFVYWIVGESGGRLAFEENEPTGTIVDIVVPRSDSA